MASADMLEIWGFMTTCGRELVCGVMDMWDCKTYDFLRLNGRRIGTTCRRIERREDWHADLGVDVDVLGGYHVGEVGEVNGRGIVDLLEFAGGVEVTDGGFGGFIALLDGGTLFGGSAEGTAVGEFVGVEAGD